MGTLHFLQFSEKATSPPKKMNKVIFSLFFVLAVANAQAPSQALADCICQNVAGSVKADEDNVAAADAAPAAAACLEAHPLAAPEAAAINAVKGMCASGADFTTISNGGIAARDAISPADLATMGADCGVSIDTTVFWGQIMACAGQ